MPALEFIASCLAKVAILAPFLAPVLIYCLPRLPKTPAEAKGRILIALATVVVSAEASYWCDWLILKIDPDRSFGAISRMMNRTALSSAVSALIVSTVGFFPVMILFSQKAGFRNFVAPEDSAVE